MEMNNLYYVQEKIGVIDANKKTHYHLMTSRHIYMVEKAVKQIKLFIYRKYNPIVLEDNQQDQ